MSESTSEKPACLVIFDFDHTLIEANSDVVAIELLTSSEQKRQIYGMRHQRRWIDNMVDCFSMLNDQGLSGTDVIARISKLPMNVGMRDLVLQLSQKSDSSPYRIEMLILSDANTLFIEAILREQGIANAFGNQVHTNEVVLVDNKIVLPPTSSEQCGNASENALCDWCGANMCKSRILRKLYLPDGRQASSYKKVVYVGDGENDCCPMRLLSEEDVAFVRRGYRAEKLIATNDRQIASAIRARIHYWTSGVEILDDLKQNHVI